MTFIQLSGDQKLQSNDIVLTRSIKGLHSQVRSQFTSSANVKHDLSLTILTFLFTLALLLYPFNSAQAIESQQIPQVQKVVNAFKQNNRVAIANMISYPLSRPDPLPPIQNQTDLLNRYNDVFDQTLLNTITRSNIHTDWDSVGWRGVILNNGIIELDPDGNITEVNYHSSREQVLINKMNSRKLAKGRRSLHRSVKNYNQAIVELVTPRFHIRVDSVGTGRGNLRYTAWPITKTTSDKPDLVLNNGVVFDSNGRNQRYIFDNGTYSYQLNISSMRQNATTTGSLEVFKNGKSWMREVATKVIRR